MRITQLFSPTTIKYKTYTVGEATFRMVELPGHDNFVMGNDRGEETSFYNEQPKHSRKINPFAMAELPVTQKLLLEMGERARFEGVLEEQVLPGGSAYFRDGLRPVNRVSWNAAQEFCRVLNLLLGKSKRYFRLPSEAEWEYAARTGVGKTLYAGSNQLDEVGWYRQNNGQETMPVGLLAPNALGLYDLCGNVWELCEDDYHYNYENHPQNGLAWLDGSGKRAEYRVGRNGSCIAGAVSSRCIHRKKIRPEFSTVYSGFRLAAPAQE